MREMPYRKGDVIVCAGQCSYARIDPHENSAGGWTYGYNPDARKATEADIALQIEREQHAVARHSRWLAAAHGLMATFKGEDR